MTKTGLFLLAALVTASARAGFTVVDTTTLERLKSSVSETVVLQDGTIYTFTSDALVKTNLVAGTNPVPAIEVASNATAVIEIPKDHVLRVKGSDSINGIPGAAAIRVPEGSTLIVTGEGTLVAEGGRAGDGSTGLRGADAWTDDDDKGRCGTGGAGGAGGAGGGSAIGGNGGKGGAGGAEVKTKEADVFEDNSMKFQAEWKVGYLGGNPGAQGGTGEAAGEVVILGCVRVSANVDRDGEGGATKTYTWNRYNISAWHHDDVFFGGGGPGGGGGGGGRPDFSLGRGGGGGGGGGSGSTGSMVLVDTVSDYGKEESVWSKKLYVLGHPGKYGLGRTSASHGKSNTDQKNHTFTRLPGEEPYYNPQPDTQEAKSAGAGGDFAATPSDGWRFGKANTAWVDGDHLPDKIVMSTHVAVAYSLRLVNASDQVETHTVTLFTEWPVILPPTRAGFVFKGYYTQRNGQGKRVIDEKGQRVEGGTYWTEHRDVTLYAYWSFTGGDEHIVVREGETKVIDEFVGDSVLRQPLAGHLFEVRRGGTLILRNKTVQGVDDADVGAILNVGTVLASNCVFVGCSATSGAGGVYADRPGAVARFERCTFKENSAHEAACILAEGSRVSLVNCTFLDNYTFATDTLGGSAVCAYDRALVNIVSCTCASNREDIVSCKNRPFRFGLIKTESLMLNSILVDNAISSIASVAEWNEYSRKLDWSYKKCLFVSDGSDALGPRQTRVCAGDVMQTSYRPAGKGRTEGCATEVWWNPEDETYGRSNPPTKAKRILADQFGEYPIAGYCGARCGNTLQHLINVTPSGGTLAVAEGLYEPVIVTNDIRVTTADGGLSVIDGAGFEPCVTLKAGAGAAVWSEFAFLNGRGDTGGGVVWSGDTACGGVVSNCVFAGNVATNCGGAAAHLKLAENCVFSNNVATVSGGGTYDVETVVRSLYVGNTAACGGGSAGGTVQTSLFLRNNALESGGGIYGSSAYNCTLASNTSVSNGSAAAGLYHLYASLLYPKNVTYTDESVHFSTFVVDSTPFADALNDDFHLALTKRKPYSATEYEKVDQSAYKVTDVSSYVNAREGWLDMDGTPILSLRTLYDPDTGVPVASNEYLYAGCYAYMPYKKYGLVVTGTADYYRNSITECSLREAVEEAMGDPFYCRNGEYVITFAPKLFARGPAVIPSSSFQIVVDGFTNATLVIRGPQNALLGFDGDLEHRAFNVRAGNSLRVENVTFRNFFGEPAGGAGADGGAIVNAGRLVVTNCAFVGCQAGNNAWKPNRPTGYGGAFATLAHGVTTAHGVTFKDNLSAKGGAIHAASGGTNRVFFSTFTGNVADGSFASGNPVGGAVSSESATWLVNCTVASNSVVKANSGSTAVSGGGVYAKTGLIAINSIIAGNFVNGATNDIGLAAGGSAGFYATTYGERTPTNRYTYATQRIVYTDRETLGGIDVRDALSSAAEKPNTSSNVWHTVVPVSEHAVELPSTCVWVSDDFANVGTGTETVCTNLVAGSKLSALVRKGRLLAVDQTGETGAASLAGATVEIGASLWDSHAHSGGGSSEDEGSDEVPESEAKFVLTTATGGKRYYATVEKAKVHFRIGDSVSAADASDEKLLDELVDTFYDYTHDQVKDRPWFSLVWSEDWSGFTLKLNELAVPSVHRLDVASTPTSVCVTLDDVRPELWYSLGYAERGLEGGFTCKTWVQADSTGYLKSFLTAPKVNADANFYKVFVLPYHP